MMKKIPQLVPFSAGQDEFTVRIRNEARAPQPLSIRCTGTRAGMRSAELAQKEHGKKASNVSTGWTVCLTFLPYFIRPLSKTLSLIMFGMFPTKTDNTVSVQYIQNWSIIKLSTQCEWKLDTSFNYSNIRKLFVIFIPSF